MNNKNKNTTKIYSSTNLFIKIMGDFNIAFVNPAPLRYIIERRDENSGAYPPLGILSIIASLKQAGYHNSVLFDQHATKIQTKHLLSKIKELDPSVIGFNSLTDISMALRSVYIAQKIKRWNPNIKICFGNYHATFNHDRILKKYPFIDICVRGEGERTFLELIEKIENQKDLTDIGGITYRDGDGKIRINKDRPLIEALDELPFPDRTALGDVKYSQNYGGINADYGNFTTIQTSRGCTFNCAFCCQARISHQKWRNKSIDRVIEELHYLEELGYTNLFFVDDNFSNNPKRTIELCKAIRKNRLDFVWLTEQRVDLVRRDMIQEMRNAGCRTISLGIESANQRILDYFNKKITPKMAQDAARLVKKAGIDFIMGTFLIGAPSETLQEIKNTLSFAHQLNIDFPQFHIFGAIPGTDVWKRLVEEEKIDPEKYWETGVKTLVPALDIVEREMRDAYINFISRPRFILDQFRRTLISKHRLKIVLSNLNIMWRKNRIERFFDFATTTWTHGISPEG
ncbi:MAG: Methyltransferase [Promethearchaeota archaeon]|nr:MAG: Methyltransferase [Candidatus Lokiarchaeota archaeon]